MTLADNNYGPVTVVASIWRPRWKRFRDGKRQRDKNGTAGRLKAVRARSERPDVRSCNLEPGAEAHVTSVCAPHMAHT